MLEIKVNIEATAPDLSQAITQLALAIKGEAVAVPGQSSFVIPAGTPMDVESVTPVNPSPAVSVTAESVPPVQNNAQPISSAPVDPVPVQPPVMNAPAAPLLDLDTISRAGAALVDQGKMQEILLILQKYGVMAVNQLRSDQYPAFADDLRALGADI